MNFLLLAIISSALISIFMRIGTKKADNNIGMLTVNYIVCCIVSLFYIDGLAVLPQAEELPNNLLLGIFNGFLYLLSFVVFQANVKKNGVVLSSIFMRLGLLVPIVISILVFDEMPTILQAIGFLIAIAAIILINVKNESTEKVAGLGLIILLLTAGSADAMSKIFEEFGTTALSSQFLFYTFFTALILCVCLMIFKKQRITKKEMIFGALVGIPNFFSAKFLLASLGKLPAVIVYPTFSVATILVVTLSGIVLFKERLSKLQWLSFIEIAVALVLLNI